MPGISVSESTSSGRWLLVCPPFAELVKKSPVAAGNKGIELRSSQLALTNVGDRDVLLPSQAATPLSFEIATASPDKVIRAQRRNPDQASRVYSTAADVNLRSGPGLPGRASVLLTNRSVTSRSRNRSRTA